MFIVLVLVVALVLGLALGLVLALVLVLALGLMLVGVGWEGSLLGDGGVACDGLVTGWLLSAGECDCTSGCDAAGCGCDTAGCGCGMGGRGSNGSASHRPPPATVACCSGVRSKRNMEKGEGIAGASVIALKLLLSLPLSSDEVAAVAVDFVAVVGSSTTSFDCLSEVEHRTCCDN